MPYIELTKGYSTRVDAEDLALLSHYKWHAKVCRRAAYRTYVYASSSAGLLSRVLLRPPADMQVDYRNHDTLDNRRRNLRVCSPTEQRRNSRHRRDADSQYKGIVWNDGSWIAQITVNKKQTYLGRYKSELDAALAYDAAALQYFGEFAHVNFRKTG